MKSRSSASIGSGSQSGEAASSSRCHQWSRPSFISAKDSSPSPDGRRRTTTQCSTEGVSRHRLVHHALERNDLSPAIAAVGGDDHSGLRVVDAVAYRLRREPAEDDRVDRADPGAREHRDDRLGQHRQIDRHPIALLHAESLERVGAATHLAREVPVGEHPAIARLSLPDERGLVAVGPGEMTIEAVGRRVERAADEPLGVGQLPVEHLPPRGDPVEAPRLLRPEALAIGGGVIQRPARVRLAGKGRRRSESAQSRRAACRVWSVIAAYRLARSGRRAARLRPCRSVSAARSSGPCRAASPPIAPAIRACGRGRRGR